VKEEDAIYMQLGRFVVFFQALENQLFQLASFLLDPEHTGAGHHVAAGLKFGELVDQVSDSVGPFLRAHRGGDERDFRETLERLLARSRELAGYRNTVVHSAYVFLETGDELLAVVRSDMTPATQEDQVNLDQEALNDASFQKTMTEIAQTALGIGQCRLQLIHWYRP
jgi:hypothetical protein